MKKDKLQNKCSELELRIKKNTGWNKARVFVITGLIISIITLGRVSLKKIATNLNPKESKEVNYRRLSRFFQYFRFEKSLMAKLLSSFLPKGQWVLSMDRTNWKFGKVHINILKVYGSGDNDNAILLNTIYSSRSLFLVHLNVCNKVCVLST